VDPQLLGVGVCVCVPRYRVLQLKCGKQVVNSWRSMKRVDMFPDGINKRARDENNRKTKRKRKQKNKKIVLKVLGSVTIRPFHLMADISKKELLHSKLKSFFFLFLHLKNQ
jgi:hypothetical protein